MIIFDLFSCLLKTQRCSSSWTEWLLILAPAQLKGTRLFWPNLSAATLKGSVWRAWSILESKGGLLEVTVEPILDSSAHVPFFTGALLEKTHGAFGVGQILLLIFDDHNFPLPQIKSVRGLDATELNGSGERILVSDSSRSGWTHHQSRWASTACQSGLGYWTGWLCRETG